MNKAIRWAGAAAALLAISQAATAQTGQLGAAAGAAFAPAAPAGQSTEIPKAASTQTLGSRGTVTPTATLFGGFQLAQRAVVYILVRGNSLGTLGVTNNFLDAPRVRIVDSQGDVVTDSFGRAGFNECLASNTTFSGPVVTYYQNVRGQPVHPRDACVALDFPAGVYTFTVTPTIPGVTAAPQSGASSPSSGEVLFEITLGP